MQEVREASRVQTAPGGARRVAVPGLFLYLGLGLGLAAGSSALTVGDLQVRSTLGQPFSGVVQVDAAAGEVIRRECFSSGSELGAMPGVPVISGVRFVVENRAGTSFLRIIGSNPVREPLAQVILQVRCPGLPRLTRSFVLLLDPATVAQAPPDIPPLSANFSPESAAATLTGQRVTGNIQPGSRYTVRAGDTLSGIASRIDGRRPYTVWPLAARIRQNNPAAFENGRADRLIIGASLNIPNPDSVVASKSPGSARAPASPSASAAIAAVADTGVVTPPPLRSSRSSTSLFDTPVLVGEPVIKADLEYLVLTPALSSLSLDRIKQRGDASTYTREDPSAQASEQQAPVGAPETSPAVEETTGIGEPGSDRSLLYLLAAALLIFAGALLAFFYARRTRHTRLESDAESPWEMEDDDGLAAAPMPDHEDKPAGMVYDDFEGTFVSVKPVEETASEPSASGREEATDPEKDVLTHLMPTVDEGAEAASTEQDKVRSDFDEVRREFTRPRDNADSTGQINVTTLEESDPDITEEGWVELDFEATQILEQDYLAEYAAKLKGAGQRDGADEKDAPEADPEIEPEIALEIESEVDPEFDEEPLILAHEMLTAPDAESVDKLELATDTESLDSDEPIVLTEPDDEDLPEDLSRARLEDASEGNVVAIAKGKSPGQNSGQSSGQSSDHSSDQSTEKGKATKDAKEPQQKGNKKS